MNLKKIGKKKVNRDFLFINEFPYNYENGEIITKLNQSIYNFNKWQLNLKPLDNVVEKLIAEIFYVSSIIYQRKPKDANNMIKIVDDMIKFINKFLPSDKKIEFINLPSENRPDRSCLFINKISTEIKSDDHIVFYINELINRFNLWQLDLKPLTVQFEKLIAYLQYVSVKLVNSKIEDKKEMELIITNIMIFINKYLPSDESIKYPDSL